MTVAGTNRRADRTAGLWPERLGVGAAAAMLDMHPATWGLLWPVLAAHYGLRVYRTCGVKFDRSNVLAVTAAHSIKLSRPAGFVEVDGRRHHLTERKGGRNGRNGRQGTVSS